MFLQFPHDDGKFQKEKDSTIKCQTSNCLTTLCTNQQFKLTLGGW